MNDWRGVEIKVGSRVVYSFNTSTSVIHAVEGIVTTKPYKEGRQRTPRVDVHVTGWSGTGEWPWGQLQQVKANRVTVLEHDTA